MSAASSSDPDGDALTFAWSFGDGAVASGVTVSHAYQNAGTYTVRLIATDIRALADTTYATATVLAPAQAIQNAVVDVRALVDSHMLDAQDGEWLENKLGLASSLLSRPVILPAVNQLEEAANRLEESNVPALLDSIRRIIESLTAGGVL